MLSIESTKAKIRGVHPRVENHGDETQLACDIALELSLSNARLDMLHPGLRSCLYTREAGAESDNQELLPIDGDVLPHLRFPLLSTIPWGYEGAGYSFELVDDGLFGDDTIGLRDCKVNKITIEPEEGGTIKLRVRVQAAADSETIGALLDYIKHDVKVSLIPPTRDDVQHSIAELPEPFAA